MKYLENSFQVIFSINGSDFHFHSFIVLQISSKINNNYFGDNKGYICAYQQFKAKSSLIDGRYMTGDDKD